MSKHTKINCMDRQIRTDEQISKREKVDTRQ